MAIMSVRRGNEKKRFPTRTLRFCHSLENVLIRDEMTTEIVLSRGGREERNRVRKTEAGTIGFTIALPVSTVLSHKVCDCVYGVSDAAWLNGETFYSPLPNMKYGEYRSEHIEARH
jgi:hypothetical protein